jgi:hypothetical protein
LANNTTRTRLKQTVGGNTEGLRRFARALLRETERGSFSEQTQRLLFDMGTLALATAFELKTLIAGREPDETYTRAQ